MSQRDIHQNRDIVVRFQGHRCFATLATNSIQFRIDEAEKKGRYIWIDPPWVFSHDGDEITCSDAYTEDTFHDWCQLFQPLRDTVLERFEEGDQGASAFIFRGGYELFVPDDGEGEQDMDYDHWYALDRRT